MFKKECNYCGSSGYIEKCVEYIYRHNHRYMVFHDVPTEICRQCGMRYFAADVLLAMEHRFFEIYEQNREPNYTMSVPVEGFMQLA